MRCPDCEKMVSYEDPPTVEALDTQVEGNLVVVQVRIVLNCAECGSELKELVADLEVEIEHECPKAEDDKEPEFELTNSQEWTGEGFFVREKGKTFYGADVSADVSCSLCEEDINVATQVKETGGNFDDLT